MADLGLTSTGQFWLEHVDACEASGLSMKAYAERHGLNLASFYCWKGQLKKRGLLADGQPRSSTTRLVAVEMERASEPEPVLAVTRIALASGIVIEAPLSVGADALCDLLRVAIAAGRHQQ